MNLPRLLPLALLLAALVPVPAAAQDAHAARSVRMAPADVGFDIDVRTMVTDTGLVTADFPVVSAVRAGTPAERVGVKPGDVILAIDGRDPREGRMFRDLAPGKRYRLHLKRGDEQLDLEVEAIARRPRTEAPAS